MAKRLSRIEREIKEHPSKFDFADIPPDYKIGPVEQARDEAARPQWLKDLVGNNDANVAASDEDDS